MKMNMRTVKKIAVKVGIGFAVGSATALVAEKIPPIAKFAPLIGAGTAFAAGGFVGAGAYAIGNDMVGSLGM